MVSADVFLNPHSALPGLQSNKNTDEETWEPMALSCLVFGLITKSALRVASKDSVGLMLMGQRSNVCCHLATVPPASSCAPGSVLGLWAPRSWGYFSPLFNAAPDYPSPPPTLRPIAVVGCPLPQQRDPVIKKSFLDLPLPRAPSVTVAAAESRLGFLPERGCGRGQGEGTGVWPEAFWGENVANVRPVSIG